MTEYRSGTKADKLHSFHHELWNRDDNFGIAIVDFGAFLDGSDNQAVANKMLASFKNIGFRVVYLLNHGIPPEWIARRFSPVLRTAHGGENARSTPAFWHAPSRFRYLCTLGDATASKHHISGSSSPGQEKVIQHVYGSDAIAEQRAQAPDVKEASSAGVRVTKPCRKFGSRRLYFQASKKHA
ncbi:hypothetical protein B0H13DRAFT_2305590 [Mycena leptocephala]|nr:hypothetical protein B0H13DRAFT_2341061 [Mycena leptocephala]KAJ7934488.1 hypothetical protein B0H13DRAFT_2305590 [Mycena leptocephala]